MLCIVTLGVAHAEPGFVVDSKAVELMKYVIRNDYSVYLSGGQSHFKYRSRVPEIKVISPEIVSDYKKNEVAANERYKGKLVRFVGGIRSSNVDANGNQYVNFVGGPNDFDDPQGRFGRNALLYPDPTDSYICLVEGRSGPTVKLSQCQGYNQEVDYDNKYLIPSYVNEQLNAWFGHGVQPEFVGSDQQATTILFAAYWAGTKVKREPACITIDTIPGCLRLLVDKLKLAMSGDQDFLDSYRTAKNFLKMDPNPHFTKKVSQKPVASTQAAARVIPVSNGLNRIRLGDTEFSIVRAFRENYNAHSFDVITFYFRSENDGHALLSLVPIFSVAKKNERSEIHEVSVGGGADCKLTDFRLINSDGNGAARLIVADRAPGDSFVAPGTVHFTYYELMQNKDGAPGDPPYYFEEKRRSNSAQKYCDVNDAFDRELRMGTTSGDGFAD